MKMQVELWKIHEMCEYGENLPRLCNAGRFCMMFAFVLALHFPGLLPQVYLCMYKHVWLYACWLSTLITRTLGEMWDKVKGNKKNMGL